MSRSDARSRRLRRRPSRTVPASIVALVLLAAGVLAVLAGVFRLIDGSWAAPVRSGAKGLAGLTWGSGAFLGIVIGVGVIGLVLLLAAIIPGGYTSARLAAGGAGVAAQTEFVISQRGLARLAAATAEEIDGVERVSASAGGHRVRVAVTTATDAEARQLRDRVQQAVSQRLSAAGVQPAARVSVSVHTRGI
ncbi:hypothetical protein FHX74_003565 [Friedmanniella endophytica]|uniref:DUF6286 domain-containing protein n=1 Tax=Microlunatus kandeliicorticis TaxID=1759536 RepID=A0A7W3IVD9_9ACTN|nr:DUF6286 domain-containing protein [Microlunatus kandeliicorticis]MBA8795924.1 hypothetical protein [Microlunatus kandeliicorticis]